MSMLESLRAGGPSRLLQDATVAGKRSDRLPAILPCGAAAVGIVQRYGRSVNMGLGADGRWHLVRRARQARRLYGNGIQITAPRRAESIPVKPLRYKLPWWFI